MRLEFRTIDGKPGEREPAYELWARRTTHTGVTLQKRLSWTLDIRQAEQEAVAWAGFLGAPLPTGPRIGCYWTGDATKF